LAVRYLSDITLPSNIVATADAKAALERATHLVHAVPVQFTRDTLRKVRKHIPAGIPVLSVSKGIETKSGQLMCDLLQELLGESHSYAFLSGPSFAREIVEGKATAVVVASEDRDLACEFSDILSSRSFRVFTSRDVIGLEVGGAVKNVIAVAAGMSEGLGLGTNAMAALVTRGCIEMRRISLSFGGRPSTLAGLSGVGDTFGTCFGPLSRNRNLGIRIGRGERLKDILASSTEVAEGVDTAFSLEKLILNRNNSFRRDLKFPIIFGVCQVRIASSSRVRARGTAVTLALPPPLRRFFEGRSPPRKAWPQ
jgi:glycerol-3-phosphate dehydrogenase (NAD+)